MRRQGAPPQWLRRTRRAIGDDASWPTGLESTRAEAIGEGRKRVDDHAIREVRESDPFAFLAVPLPPFCCPLLYLPGTWTAPFVILETPESARSSPHARAPTNVVSLGRTASYWVCTLSQRLARVDRPCRNSYRPPSFIYRAVLILRRTRFVWSHWGASCSGSNSLGPLFHSNFSLRQPFLPQVAGSGAV
jgi:hypothetical protein